ncbi:MAG: oligoendopeptidase F [Bacillota bacterium]|nr:oligoendopeptidase F [Bacillota bacterium]
MSDKVSDKVLLRSEVDVNETWDLSALFPSEAAYEEALTRAQRRAEEIAAKYIGKVDDPKRINEALDELREFTELSIRIGSYASLPVSVDGMNPENQARAAKMGSILSKNSGMLSFIESEILECSEDVIRQAMEQSPGNAGMLKHLLEEKPHRLHSEAERVLKSLGPVMDAPFRIYSEAKSADLDYEPLKYGDRSYPMSFVLYENNYEHERDTELRRATFREFSKGLRKYNHTMAATYSAQLQKEKILATLRGYESVFDYLLFPQKVDASLYHRQIDCIMEKLAGPMRKYARLLKAIHKIDRMTYADLKISVDYDYEPKVSIADAKRYVIEALSMLGDEYRDMLEKAFDERWIDFPVNKGKRSGAFCSSPYGAHPYIMISWSHLMMEAFVLAHELGHAGHFYLAQQVNNLFDMRSSMYFVEAPSTMNELLMANYLMKEKSEPRFRRWVLSSMISRTYFHNFVTHLLEAHFQREVYRIIDAGGSVQASKLNALKKATLEKFWGDEVHIDDDAELTWMRQLHYYMGLYPYTYSAGLTIATAVNNRILKEGQPAIDDWKKVLRAGGTKTPVELAAMAGVDITTEQPLLDTIDTIAAMIDEICALTAEIDGIVVE